MLLILGDGMPIMDASVPHYTILVLICGGYIDLAFTDSASNELPRVTVAMIDELHGMQSVATGLTPMFPTPYLARLLPPPHAPVM